jgi:serine/threonine protein kinase
MESGDQPTLPEQPAVYYGDFEICRKADGSLHELGRGGMGITYKAHNRQFKEGIPLALKIIKPREGSSNDPTARPDPELEERIRQAFLREGEAVASVDHPNVARAYQRGCTEEGEFYLVMEFIEGDSLLRFLNQQHPRQLPWPVALAIAKQTAWALRAIHDKNFLHRDLKPSNIMLKRDIEADNYPDEIRQAGGCLVKVIDFGLAKGMTGSQLDAVTHFTPQYGPGTAHYASPEQLAGSDDLLPSWDIYSLGAVLWEMLVGTPPHDRYRAHALRADPYTERPLPPEALMRLPTPLMRLLKRMLAFLPENRPQDTRELLAEIELCRAELTALETPLPHGEKPPTLDAPPAVGDTIADRYRIDVWHARGDGGNLFRATDQTCQRPVALKWLSCPPSAERSTRLAELQQEWRKIADNPHPNLLIHDAEDLHVDLARTNAPGYFVREWAAGLSLSDLLPILNALSAPELFQLLPTLPGALDHAAQHDFRMAEITLRKVIVVRSPVDEKAAGGSEWTREDWGDLRGQALTQWPALSLKYNPLGFPSITSNAGREDNSRDAVTRTAGYALLTAASAVRGLALMIRELLAAPIGSDSPIPALGGEKINGVLRHGLTGKADGGIKPYGSCQEFWDALRAAYDAERLPVLTEISIERAALPRHEGVDEAPPSRLVPWARAHWKLAATTLAAVGTVSLLAVAYLWPANKVEMNRNGEHQAANTADASAESAAARVLSQPYTNTLGMKFVPVPMLGGGTMLLSICETRIAEYSAVMGKGANSEANFPVWEILNGEWKQAPGNWKDCGFQQTPLHPVVAVSLIEARRFCDALTDLERRQGRLSRGLRYRLPKQAEWEAAVNANAAAARYVWGMGWPPPNGSGNYAGLEAKTAGWPESYGVIEDYQDAFPRTALAGGFRANALGIHDLEGNVSEWCDDPKDESRQAFAVRGGSWLSGDKISLSAKYVTWHAEDYRAANVGFRCALAPE